MEDSYYGQIKNIENEQTATSISDQSEESKTPIQESTENQNAKGKPINDDNQKFASLNPDQTIQTTKNIPDYDAGKPMSISIPKINVLADVLHIGLAVDGAVGVPDDAFDVSWFDMGARPGQKGSSLISGHTGIWKDGTHSIFDYLHTLQTGDEIYIKDDMGKTMTFTVQSTKIYGKDDIVPELFASADTANLNIITCHGTWLPAQKTYSQRFVVFAKLSAVN